MLNGDPSSAKLATPPATGIRKPARPAAAVGRLARLRDELHVHPLDALGQGGVAEQGRPVGVHGSSPRRGSDRSTVRPPGGRSEGRSLTRGLRASTVAARRADAHYRPPVRVLITGGAGFIGSHVADRLARRRPRARPARRAAPAGARGRARRTPAGTSWSAATCATPICWPGCCPASTPCAIRRRWSGTASTPRTPRPTPRTTTWARRCSSPRCTPPGCAGWCWRARWSSTARAATTARSTGRCAPARGRRPTSTPGASSRAAPGAAATWSRGWSARTPRSTRAAPTPPPRPPRSTSWPRGRGRRAELPGRCATTTSTGRGCRATRRTQGSRRSSAPRWNGARRRGCWRTAVSGATSCTSPTSPRPTCSPWRRTRPGPGSRPSTSARGSRTRSATWRPRSPRRSGDRRRGWSAAPGPATSGTSSPILRGPRALLGFRAAVGFTDGVRAFATDPLRAPARARAGDVTER